MTNPEHIDRLARALTFYREHLPKHPGYWHDFAVRTAKRFNINVSLFRQALRLLSELEDSK